MIQKRANKRVTIRDVAAVAGVSVTTVSHALNGKGRIESETIKRIRGAAERLGYQPSAAARNLRGGRTGRVAVINSQSSPYRESLGDLHHFVRLLVGASEHAVGQGYTTVLTLSPLVEGQSRFPVDGVILVDPVSDEPLLAALHLIGIPVVTTGRDPNGHDTEENWVDNDLREATRRMLDHLSEQGARRVGLVASSPMFSYSQDALAAYREWAAEHGVPALISEVEGALSESGGFIAVQALLDQPQPPDAIHCVTDRYAIGVLLAAESRGLRVPEDLLISAGTDSDAARTNVPSITALDLNPETIGRNASELLISLIEGKRIREQRIVPFDLVVRDSTRR
jgi:DNA-binding LacI/PurR family transcriptional regulator